MCLSSQVKLSQFQKLIERGYGWKQFELKDEKGRTRLYGETYASNCVRPIGKWLNQKDFDLEPRRKTIEDVSGKRYPKGWHIYLEKRKSRSTGYVTRKVKFRGVKVAGYGNDIPEVIAEEILITLKI